MGAAEVRVLEDAIVNQIAAGEVVERPASVIKELVENSLDAGARDISITIESGGKGSIIVQDDGIGMSQENALRALERFGTSKISQASDLEAIATLGFRGEALPSIASVSRLSILTRTPEATQGSQVELEYGEQQSVQELPCREGTTVTVRSLFGNVPARKKFLRSDRSEANAVRSLVLNFAAAYPDISFRLYSDGRDVLAVRGAGSFFDRVKQVKLAGKDPLRIDVEEATSAGPLRIRAMLSQPTEAVVGGQRLRLVVNGRVVRDRLLLRAVKEGYGAFLKSGRYPLGVLELTVLPETVDVNVHPQKSEIRFRYGQTIFAVVARVVRSALSGVEILPGVAVAGHVNTYGRAVVGGQSEVMSVSEQPSFEVIAGSGSLGSQAETSSGMEPGKLSTYRFVGQIFHCYLLFEGPEQFAVVDMHAAHERVVYGRLKQQFAEGELVSQQLLIPETLEVADGVEQRLGEFSELLSALGIDCEVFGSGTVVIRAVPALLSPQAVRATVQELLCGPEWRVQASKGNDHVDMAIARLACHGSVRSGRELERSEAFALIESLEEVEGGAYCPHGRPVVREYSKLEVEGMFGRV